MLKITVKTKEKSVDLMSLKPGDMPGSMTDYSKPETEIVMFMAQINKSVIMKSLAGYSIEHTPTLSEVHSFKSQVMRELTRSGETYELPITTKFGKATILFEHK